MPNKFQIKRTSVSGRTPNTTNVANAGYIDAGELAVNLTDRKLFSSNGSTFFEVGANLVNLNVTNSISVANAGINVGSGSNSASLNSTFFSLQSNVSGAQFGIALNQNQLQINHVGNNNLLVTSDGITIIDGDGLEIGSMNQFGFYTLDTVTGIETSINQGNASFGTATQNTEISDTFLRIGNNTLNTYANSSYVRIGNNSQGTLFAYTINTNSITITGNTVANNIDMQDSVLTRPILKDYALTHNPLGSITGATTIDLTLGNFVSATITGATQFTFSNPAPTANACGFILELTNGGSATITWPSSVTKWPGGSAPSLTASGVDVLVFITDDSGSTWRGVLSMGDSK